jgi:hypothetical protein
MLRQLAHGSPAAAQALDDVLPGSIAERGQQRADVVVRLAPPCRRGELLVSHDLP